MTKKETFGGEIAKQLPVKEIYTDLAHPALSTVGEGLQGAIKLAFVQIIKQLSSDECKMIKYLSTNNVLPMIKIRMKANDKGEIDLTP